MNNHYALLFSPGKIGSLELKNRMIMTAMGTGMGTTDRCFSDQMIAFYEERARGGVGLILPETSMVNEITGPGAPCQISFADDRIIPSTQKLADTLHRYGTKLFIQLYHPGREVNAKYNPGTEIVSASDVASKSGNHPRPMTTEEVYQLIDQFEDAAWRAQRGGADGVEVHAGHGYLLNQFLSPYTNKRTDAFGGSREARSKVVCDIIRAIHQRCGCDFPVMVRISVEEFIGEKGIELPEGVEICKLLEAAGADALNVTCGIYDTMKYINEPFSFQEGWRTYLAGAVKSAVRIPVTGNGKIRHADFAEALLRNGNQDFIGMARSYLADPEWCNKMRTGREDEVRYCISCMRCSESRGECGSTGMPISCSVNPQMGRELRYPGYKTDGYGKTAVVIGGGPSGMEAARVLAKRRFKTILIEKNSELGGQLCYARVPYRKERINWLIQYYRKQLELLHVDVRLGAEANVEDVLALNPYTVVVATGGIPLVPGSMPGVHGKNVHLTTDILSGKLELRGKKIAVVGSGVTGLEVAEMLASADNEVSIIEMAEKLTPDGFYLIVEDIMERLIKYGVQFYPAHKLVEITDHSVKLEGRIQELEADEVILALGIRRKNDLYDEIRRQIPNTFCTGDSSSPGKIYQATSSAFFAAQRI